jgi:endonuclease I
MKHILAAVLLVLLVTLALCNDYYDESKDAQDRTQYYKLNAAANANVDIKALSQLLASTHKHQTSYDEARLQYLYPSVDRREDHSLKCIYSEESFSAHTDGNVRISLRGVNNQPAYNCEHSVPQSWFNKRLPMKGDLHHLFTAEAHCNSFRGNFPFASFDSSQGDSVQKEIAGCGKLFDTKQGTKSFDPINGRGAVARAVLYFMVRYPGSLSRANFPERNFNDIKRWAKEHPVSVYEKHRNSQIFNVQGNRNPFIDFPEYVDQIEYDLSAAGRH